MPRPRFRGDLLYCSGTFPLASLPQFIVVVSLIVDTSCRSALAVTGGRGQENNIYG